MKAIEYKQFLIIIKNDSHCAIITNMNGDILKCIAGDIFSDGNHNAIDKSKKYIDTL